MDEVMNVATDLNMHEASIVKKIEWNIILPLVKEIRHKLETTHNMQEHLDFMGLCDEASTMMVDELMLSAELKEYPVFDLEIVKVHGEMNHKPFIPSKYWPRQNTWVEIGMNFETKNLNISRIRSVYIYVDCTCQQFRNMFEDIPDFYISTLPPRWFYPDRYNWARKEDVFVWLNENIRISVRGKGNKYQGNSIGLSEYCQYEIWGKISDWLGKKNILAGWKI